MTLSENALARYIKESYDELKKVVWPTKETIKNHTLVVIFLSLALAAFLSIIDYALSLGLNKFLIK